MSVYVINPPTFFIHIPKTAGRSVEFWMNKNLKGKSTGKIHAKLRPMQNSYHNIFGTRNIFHFTVVRNPYARMYSLWKYSVWRCEQAGRPQYMPFDEFLGNTSRYTYNIGFHEQTTFIGKHTVVLKYETLSQDFELIQDRFKCSEPLPYRNSHPASGGEYMDAYTPEMIAIMQKKFPSDFRRFGYAQT